MGKLALVPLKSRIGTISSAYGSAARSVISTLSPLNPDTYDSVKGAAALSRIRELIGILDAKAQRWTLPSIRAAYREGAGVARVKLEAIGARELPAKRYDAKRHDKRVRALAKTVLADYWKANRTIERTARKYLGVLAYASRKLESVQAFTPEEVKALINRMVAASLKAKTKYNEGEAHLTSKDIAAKIREKLLGQLGGGDFIEINGRHYNVRDYAELVARTRMREAQSEAIKELCRQFDNDLVEIPPHDDPCAEICAPYQGQIYSISGNHPRYPKLPDGGPPWHPKCLLPGARCIAPGGVIAGHRAFYNGQAVELVFAEGGHLSVTVNHMLLTPQGFAPAYLLRQGDDIFYCPDFERIISANPDENQRPTLIEDIVGSLSKSAGMLTYCVPVSPEYFHGDGRCCNGHIDIIRANGFLKNGSKPAPGEHGSELYLDPGSVALPDLFGRRDLRSMLKSLAFAADGFMGGLRSPARSSWLARPAEIRWDSLIVLMETPLLTSQRWMFWGAIPKRLLRSFSRLPD